MPLLFLLVIISCVISIIVTCQAFIIELLCNLNTMAPSGKQLTIEVRQLIIRLNGEGNSVREIAKIIGKPKSTIHDIIKRYQNEFRLQYKSREGQGKKLTVREERRIVSEVNKNPFKSAKDLKVELEKTTGKDVCVNTIRNVLYKNDFHGRIARNKPFISAKNKKLRMEFAKKYFLETPEFWKTVIHKIKVLNNIIYLFMYYL